MIWFISINNSIPWLDDVGPSHRVMMPLSAIIFPLALAHHVTCIQLMRYDIPSSQFFHSPTGTYMSAYILLLLLFIRAIIMQRIQQQLNQQN